MSVIVLFAVALIQTPAPADPRALHLPAPVGFAWAEQPDLEDLHAAFGASAPEGGRVSMQCRVEADGRLTTCSVRGAVPDRQGLAEAALGLSGRYRVALDGGNTRLVGQDARFSIYWPAIAGR
jgi:hypothetical protein